MKHGARITSVLFDVVPLTDCNIVSYFLAFPFEMNLVCVCSVLVIWLKVRSNGHTHHIKRCYIFTQIHKRTQTHIYTHTINRAHTFIRYRYNIIAIIDDWRTSVDGEYVHSFSVCTVATTPRNLCMYCFVDVDFFFIVVVVVVVVIIVIVVVVYLSSFYSLYYQILLFIRCIFDAVVYTFHLCHSLWRIVRLTGWLSVYVSSFYSY